MKTWYPKIDDTASVTGSHTFCISVCGLTAPAQHRARNGRGCRKPCKEFIGQPLDDRASVFSLVGNDVRTKGRNRMGRRATGECSLVADRSLESESRSPAVLEVSQAPDPYDHCTHALAFVFDFLQKQLMECREFLRSHRVCTNREVLFSICPKL